MDVELQSRSILACELVADVARDFGEVCLAVTGASMIPALWPGDIIIVRHRETVELKPGDIALYRRQNQLVAHRITRIRRDLLTTRGDSLPSDDPPVRESDIVGQVVSVVRNGHCVPPARLLRRRTVSFLLQRSDFCTRMVLRFGRRIQRYRNVGIT